MLQQWMLAKPGRGAYRRAVAFDLAVDHPETVGGLTDPQQHLMAAAVFDDVIAVDRFP